MSGLEEFKTWSIGPSKGHRKLSKFVFLDTSMTDLGTGMPSAPASGQHWPILARILLVVGRIFIQLKLYGEHLLDMFEDIVKIHCFFFLASYHFIVFRRFWLSSHSL